MEGMRAQLDPPLLADKADMIINASRALAHPVRVGVMCALGTVMLALSFVGYEVVVEGQHGNDVPKAFLHALTSHQSAWYLVGLAVLGGLAGVATRVAHGWIVLGSMLPVLVAHGVKQTASLQGPAFQLAVEVLQTCLFFGGVLGFFVLAGSYLGRQGAVGLQRRKGTEALLPGAHGRSGLGVAASLGVAGLCLLACGGLALLGMGGTFHGYCYICRQLLIQTVFLWYGGGLVLLLVVAALAGGFTRAGLLWIVGGCLSPFILASLLEPRCCAGAERDMPIHVALLLPMTVFSLGAAAAGRAIRGREPGDG